VREANPEAQLPAVFEAGAGYRLAVAEGCPDNWAKEAAMLLEGAYWLGGTDNASVAAAHRASAASVGVRDERGDLVASARALSDRRRTAWIYDVVVRPDHRGRGLGKLLVERLLEHPALRETRFVRLGTRDAQGLYARFGFEACGVTPTGATEMVLRRAADRSASSLESAQNGTGPASVQR
jgi:ribosomal protein S18 acetylase RimI-like enzyme